MVDDVYLLSLMFFQPTAIYANQDYSVVNSMLSEQLVQETQTKIS